MKKCIQLLFVLFICSSCFEKNSQNQNITELEMKTYHEWLYTNKVENLKTNGEKITRPPGVEQNILKILIPTESGLSFKTHCLYYQIPYKQRIGILKIIELKDDTQCPEQTLVTPWLEIFNVKDLTVTLENFKLKFDFLYQGNKVNWLFLLPNLENGLIHQKIQAVKENKLYSGMSFLRINDESFDSKGNKYLGKLSDRFSLGSSIRCRQISKDCQLVGEDRCDDCRYGWFQVVDYNCPQGGSRFCGQNHCGEKDEPACPRGNKVVGGEDLGICQSDLAAITNSDHLLVCH